MKVILLEEVYRLGNIGDIINVKNGYAVNYLIPTKKAVKETKESLKILEKQKVEIEKKKAEIVSKYQTLSSQLSEIKTLKIEVSASEDKKIFGSVNAKIVAEEIKKAHELDIDKKYIYFKENIKLLGKYEIEFRLNKEMKVTCELDIVAKKKK